MDWQRHQLGPHAQRPGPPWRNRATSPGWAGLWGAKTDRADVEALLEAVRTDSVDPMPVKWLEQPALSVRCKLANLNREQETAAA